MKEETKSPQQILDQSREEFEKKFIRDEHGFECEGCCIHGFREEILSWHASTLQSFIEAEITRLEGMKKKEMDIIGQLPYNQAIDDQITHLKGIISNLKR